MIRTLMMTAYALVSCALLAPIQADETAPRWFRGNTHTHTLWSDGNQFPEIVADDYKHKGYDFLVLSDHNVLSEGEKWVKLSDAQASIKKRVKADIDLLEQYRQRLGNDWVEARSADGGTEVRLKTLQEFRPRVEEPGRFLMIKGEEISQGFTGELKGKQVHTNALNHQHVIGRQKPGSVREVIRSHALAVRRQEQQAGVPMLAHLNHPNYKATVTAEDLAAVTEVEFMEIYNGHPGTLHRGGEHHPGDERLWDIANTIRLGAMQAPPIFGLASDDAHNHHNQRRSSTGRGWINVRTHELSAAAIISALRNGHFYSSTGVTLTDIQYKPTNRSITIHIQPEPGERYTTTFVGTRENADLTPTPRLDGNGQPRLQTTAQYADGIGEVFDTQTGNTATYQLAGDELYVRAVVTSNRAPYNPIYDDQSKKAWTQPVGWHRHVTDPHGSRLTDPLQAAGSQ